MVVVMGLSGPSGLVVVLALDVEALDHALHIVDVGGGLVVGLGARVHVGPCGLR